MRRLASLILSAVAIVCVGAVVFLGCSARNPNTAALKTENDNLAAQLSAKPQNTGITLEPGERATFKSNGATKFKAEPASGDQTNQTPGAGSATVQNNASAYTNIPRVQDGPDNGLFNRDAKSLAPAPSAAPSATSATDGKVNLANAPTQVSNGAAGEDAADAMRLRRAAEGITSVYEQPDANQSQGQAGGSTVAGARAYSNNGGVGGGNGNFGGGGRAGGRGRGGGGGGGGAGGRGAFIAPGAGVATPIRPRIVVPLQNEELWIISRPTAPVVLAEAMNTVPGTGSLIVRLPDKPQEQVAVPLKHTDVKASISGYIATVDVTQQYHNPYSTKIEAQYVFPLPQNAAVNEFLMTVGDRKIRGIIRDREEAQKIYTEARAQGYVASLMTQERPNIFSQSVANIEPGKSIDIDVKYFHTLEYVDGWYEWNFPMVVGPRFNPPYTSDGVGAVGMGSHGASGQSTEIQYLKPNQRSGHDISLAVSLDAGVKIEQLESVNHRVVTNSNEGSAATVILSPTDSIPNKDFVLRYKVAGDTVKSAAMVQKDKDGNGGYFTLMLVPPANLSNLPRQPLEMVFTLDISGSMSGQPIEQSRKAIQYALTHMRPEDTFQVVRFFNNAESMTPAPVPATPENVAQGLQYIQTMQAGGGTMMMEGIRKSLEFPADEGRLRFVAFLTDGFIGNEAEILGEVHKSLKNSRIFSFGVGNAPNRYLLDHMAKMGAGAAAYVSLNENPDEVMSAYFDRISHPAMTDVQLDFGGMQVSDVFPNRIPDVFVGRPVIITGRYTGKGADTIRVKGRVGGSMKEFAVPVRFDDSANQHPGIAAVWARNKISELADQSTWDQTRDFATDIKQVALNYGLMSQFTSFVAVDSSSRTAGSFGVSIPVPVPVPDGVRYDTTVQNGQPARGVIAPGARRGGGGAPEE